MMSVDAGAGRPPLVLLVDAAVASRHAMWRALHRAFGVLEADSVEAARAWVARRPDIDILVVNGDLHDGRALDLAREVVAAGTGRARKGVVLSSGAPGVPGGHDHELTQLDEGDLHGVVTQLASWLSTRDAGQARLVLSDAERLLA